MTAEHHHGECQCGAIAFDVTVDLSKTVTCNCSRCQRLGSILGFTTVDNFTLLRGKDHLTEYLFNKNVIRHQFCKVCGIEPFAFAPGKDGTPMVAINANCLDGVNPRELKSHHVDGRSF